MQTGILSLNISHPEPMVWNDKQVVSSMHKRPVPGPLHVSLSAVEGDSFANKNAHGVSYSVLYALGMTSALEYVRRLGLSTYGPGMAGENLTLEELDEMQISAGDVFRIGEVLAQATFPRIPCGKLNIRMQHPEGQKAMQQCGRSGVYFKIIEPGKIHLHDRVERVSQAEVPFLICDLYRKVVANEAWSQEEIARAQLNGHVPPKFLRQK